MFPIPLYIYFLLTLISFASSTIGAIAGFAGGVFIVPLYSFILSTYGVPVTVIVGSSAAGVIFTGLISTIVNFRNKEIDWLLAIIFEVPTVIGSITGAYTTSIIEERYILLVFALFATFLTISLIPRIFKKKEKFEEENTGKKRIFTKWLRWGPKYTVRREHYSYSIPVLILILAGFFIGFLAGMIGAGGGWAKTPVLVTLFGVPPQIAVSTALLMTTITLLSSSISHIILGNFVIEIWVTIAIGSVCGGFFGSKIKNKLSGRAILTVVFSVLVTIIIMLMIEFISA